MSAETKSPKKQETKWAAVLWYIHLHVIGIFAIWLALTSAKWMTLIYTAGITFISFLGLTIGAHRLWAHQAYRASNTVKIFLMLAHTLAGVGPIYDWVLYHRLHHKLYGTEKDPYNHKKGFLYSHYLGNALSPMVDIQQAKTEIDMRDIDADGYVWLQKHFYWPMFAIFSVILPLNVPLAYWDESMTETILIAGILRLVIALNVCWLVNSARIIWNVKGDKLPPDSMNVFIITQTFWPAYHYMAPWDWKSSEFGKYGNDSGSFLIKMWYELGLVENLRTSTTEDIRDMLHKMAKQKVPLDEALRDLKETSMLNTETEKLMVRY